MIDCPAALLLALVVVGRRSSSRRAARRRRYPNIFRGCSASCRAFLGSEF